MLPATPKRVPQHTEPDVNARIERATVDHLRESAQSLDAINARLAALDREWDIERALELGAASLVALGAGAALLRGSRWSALPVVVGGFLLEHALQGWCPPVELFRRLNFRTAREIATERAALKALRGDFRWATPITEGGNRADADTAFVAAKA